MSILAEKKRKQKWSLNPRGKLWAEDANKFGQKMLEKMGWSHGKGLGAKEDGRTEHIKVSYKNDSQGMGYKETDDQWTEHESNYTALLETLGANPKESEIKLSSLEAKSQNSKARVHYKKFTRGKDLSRYSEKDLANIFGKKSLKKDAKHAKKVVEEMVERSDNSFSHGGLMSDYFKKKVPGFGNTNGFVVGNNGVLQKAEESDGDEKPSFGFGFTPKESESESKLNVNLGFGFNQNVKEESTKKKKKKSFLEEPEETIEDTPSKKKKITSEETKTKSKKSKSNDTDSGLSNPAFDPMFSPVKVEKHTLEPIEENLDDETLDDTTLNDTAGQVAEMFEVQVQINNDGTPVKGQIEGEARSKSKKLKKAVCSNMDSSEVKIEASSPNPTLNHSEGQETPKKKKKKPKNYVTEEMDISEVNNSEPKESKKHKKKLDDPETPIKKKKSKSKGIDNPHFEVPSEELPTDNPYEVKPKKNKKKSKQIFALENPIFDPTDSPNPSSLKNEEFEVKRKKTKTQEGITNPALNLTDSIIEEENCDLMLNISVTPVQTTNSSTKDDPASIKKVKTSVQRQKSVRFSDVTRERIIPCKEELESETLDDSRSIVELQGTLNDSAELSYMDKCVRKKKKSKTKGLVNQAFDQQANNIEENITSISRTLETFQAEIENDINETKVKALEVEDIMVGEVGNPEGPNEKLPDGSVKLKFKYANFKKSAAYMQNLTGAKKSYKHLIKGDIIMEFKESNLHEVEGYALSNKS